MPDTHRTAEVNNCQPIGSRSWPHRPFLARVLPRGTVDHCWPTFLGQLRRAGDASVDPFVQFRAMGDAFVSCALDHPGQ